MIEIYEPDSYEGPDGNVTHVGSEMGTGYVGGAGGDTIFVVALFVFLCLACALVGAVAGG